MSQSPQFVFPKRTYLIVLAFKAKELYICLPRLRHANTVPTHENAHCKGAAAFGGGPLVVWIKMCWHGVGMPQSGI